MDTFPNNEYITVVIYWRYPDGKEYHTPVRIKPDQVEKRIETLNERWAGACVCYLKESPTPLRAAT